MLAAIFLVLLIFQNKELYAWSGIIIDGHWGGGNTQLYLPGNPPVNIPNINFGLSHLLGGVAVMLNGNAYFTGTDVKIFNPKTNTSTPGTPCNVGREYHAATVVGDTIIVCGGILISSCEQYSPTTQKWNFITPMPI